MMFWFVPAARAGVFMPEAATKVALEVDSIYTFLLWASFISFVLLIGGMTYFVLKYKRQSATDKTPYISHDSRLEFLWSFIPFLIFMFVFAWGWKVYHDIRTMPEDALEIHIVGKKWFWTFTYKSGKTGEDVKDSAGVMKPSLVVPVGRPVKLIMSSEAINPNDPNDQAVIHSFYVPAFRIKQDVVPGRYSALWFQADKIGNYNVFCAEYCGDGHSDMRAIIRVVPQKEFEEFLAAGSDGPLSIADKGKALYQSKACVGCHSLDGSRLVGPSFKGLFGKNEELESGSAKVDEDYLRESILEPNAKIAKSYPSGVMPTFKGQLTDEEILSLIEFIKAQK